MHVQCAPPLFTAPHAARSVQRALHNTPTVPCAACAARSEQHARVVQPSSAGSPTSFPSVLTTPKPVTTTLRSASCGTSGPAYQGSLGRQRSTSLQRAGRACPGRAGPPLHAGWRWNLQDEATSHSQCAACSDSVPGTRIQLMVNSQHHCSDSAPASARALVNNSAVCGRGRAWPSRHAGHGGAKTINTPHAAERRRWSTHGPDVRTDILNR
jgi:hypothetical protein